MKFHKTFLSSNYIHCPLFCSQDRNRIVLTVNHKEESQHSRKSVAPNKSKSPTKSNKTTGNGPYATQNTTTSNGSPEEVCWKLSKKYKC
jgi:hypothetical protein